MESNNIFEKYVGRKYGQRVNVCMMRVELIVTEIDHNLFSKFKTAEAKKNHVDTLEFWELELYQNTKEYYTKLNRVIRNDISTVHGLLNLLCHVILQNKLEVDTEYQMMESTNGHDAMVLYQLIKNICNGSVSVVVEDVLGNLIEDLHNFTLIRGDE